MINLVGKINIKHVFTGQIQRGTGGGTSNYEKLQNKPQINGIELIGNQKSEDLGLQSKNKYASVEEPGTIKVGNNLTIDDQGFLSVDTTNNAEEDNTKPMTSAGVYIQLGNINSLLEQI